MIAVLVSYSKDKSRKCLFPAQNDDPFLISGLPIETILILSCP